MSTFPSIFTPGREGLVISALAPTTTSTASASKRSATTQTVVKSATVAKDSKTSGPTSWPEVTLFSTKYPSIGDCTVYSLWLSSLTFVAPSLAAARRLARTAFWWSCLAAISSLAGRAPAFTMACTRARFAFATETSKSARFSSARSSAISRLATENSGSPAATASPSST
ncbi:MAG: hypothetical protein BWX66_01999 [Deltaproteobacteria bacterium ADurb.Bin058]|nr:MAG: hypothetical protein BWX66_01999 [Deltaproteobacteria bacterium ADurb.Bin058]